MMKLAAIVLVFVSVHALAQFTTVSGTITDPNGLPYANGTISAKLVSSASPTLNGFAYTPPSQPTGLSSAGSFVMQLADNTQLSPGGSTWNFKVCSAGATVQPAFGVGPVCFTVNSLMISGAAQSITTQLTAAALALTSPFSGGGIGGGSIRVCDTHGQAGGDLGARIIACDLALGGTQETLYDAGCFPNCTPPATPGVIRVNSNDVGPTTTWPVFVSSGHTLSLGPGVYTNALVQGASGGAPPFMLSNNSSLLCDSWDTIIQNSSNTNNGNPVVVYSANSAFSSNGTNWQIGDANAESHGITVSGCHFQDSGLGKLSTLTATVFLNNCSNCKVTNSWFDGIGVTGVGLIGAFFTGTNCTTFPNWVGLCQKFGDGDEIAGNLFTGTQEAISVINNQNVDIHDNKMANHAISSSAYIDLEPNNQKDYMQWINIHDNIFDCSLVQANTGCFGVTFQAVGPFSRGWKIHDNIYFGVALGQEASGQTTEFVSIGGSFPHGDQMVEIYDNKAFNTNQPSITMRGTDQGRIQNNLFVCNQGGINLGPDVTGIKVTDNRLLSPQLVTFTLTSVAGTTDQATTVYTGTITGGASSAFQNLLVQVSGFTNAPNNGVFGVSASTATTLTLFNPAGVTETHSGTASYGCESSGPLYREQEFTTISEIAPGTDFNLFRDNIAGQVLTVGAHSYAQNTLAEGGGTDGSSQTFQIPTGFASAIPGALSIGQLTAPVLTVNGPAPPPITTCTPLGNGTYFYIVTAVDAAGGQVPSNEISTNIGSNGCPHPGWTYVAGAASYSAYRSTTTGTEQLVQANIPQGQLAFADPGGQTPGASVPTVNSSGGMQFGSLTFAKLPAASNGTMFFCSDCKNVTDDTTGTFDSVAASGGHGTNVLRENGAWRVH